MWYVLLVALFSIISAIQVSVDDSVPGDQTDLEDLFNESISTDSDIVYDSGILVFEDPPEGSLGQPGIGDINLIMDASTMQVVDGVLYELFNNSIIINSSDVDISDIDIAPLIH